jgi:hypothetical protein
MGFKQSALAWHARFLIVVLLFCFSPAVGRENVFDTDDRQRISSLEKRAHQIIQGLLDADKGVVVTSDADFQISDCLHNLFAVMDRIATNLGHMGTLVYLASVMVDRSDESTVLGHLKIHAIGLLSYVENDQTFVTQTMRHCRRNTLLSLKAQEVLAFVKDVASLTNTIFSRFPK